MIRNTRGPLAATAFALAAMAASVSVPVDKPARIARKPTPPLEKRGEDRGTDHSIRVAGRSFRGG